MAQPFVRILGSADWLPTPENDGACCTIGDEILVDTGWCIGTNLINHGIDPLRLKTLCFTHMHADHYMGLPQLLLYWRIKAGSLAGLTIAGPAPSVRMAFERAFALVFHDSHDITKEIVGLPRILELHGGDSFETDSYSLSVCTSIHATPSLGYRARHKETGHCVGISGDTMYVPAFGAFYKGCDLLIHESSFGAGPIVPERNLICKHSSAQEAVAVANEATVKRLLLTHSILTSREPAVKAAQAQTQIPVAWAQPYEVYPF